MGRYAASGLVLGIGWGVAARIWMRLISSSPEFSWAGTLTILALAGLTGLCLGLASGANRVGRSRWWRLTGIPALVLFAGPGMVFLPALFLGGWSLAGRGPRWLRVSTGVLGLVGTPVMAWSLVSGDAPLDLPSTLRLLAGAAVLGVAVAAGSRGLFRRSGQSRALVVDSDAIDGQAVPRASHPHSREGLVARRP